MLRQTALVADLAAAGHDTIAAESLLGEFEAIQAEHVAHLVRITERYAG